MKKLILSLAIVTLLMSCGNVQKNKENKSTDQAEAEITVLSVDELYEKAGELADKEIVVKGTVMHVCSHGGERCFIMGSNEDINIRIEAGEKIGTFGQELMGSDLQVVGVLREVKTEADAHNPGEHSSEEQEGEEHDEDIETENAHKVIAESQEEAETIYFIEGIKSKEL